ETANLVSVLEEREGRLVLTGKTPPLAPTETIYSARFMGDRGFVVTFRQVDPLFTFDLSDPTNPRVVGELKIPGFSTYLHPVGDHHLLGIGEDRDEDGNWSSRRLKVSLYDVSDLSNPVEQFKYVYGNASAHSEASYDHKAFNYFPSRSTLALPVNGWGADWNDFHSGLLVLDVDVERGFTLRGSLSFDDVYIEHGVGAWSYYYQPNVRRSVMADEFVYAISDAGIRVADVADLSTPVATAPFTPLWPKDGSL
ncbi:MAG TPA: beta-propeller domain-containing protein, partial [Myxococcaceae bacterium]|nr:beta-propeller domain-containing protein [Myxococcaceae bacterium]